MDMKIVEYENGNKDLLIENHSSIAKIISKIKIDTDIIIGFIQYENRQIFIDNLLKDTKQNTKDSVDNILPGKNKNVPKSN